MDVTDKIEIAMGVMEAIEIIEADFFEDDIVMVQAYQTLIDTGVIWKLQGCYGRTAATLIENGICHK